MKVNWEPIHPNKLNQFNEILKACGGRYISNPTKDKDGNWRVSYEYDDINAANEHSRRWLQLNTEIQEIDNRQFLKTLYNRIKYK